MTITARHFSELKLYQTAWSGVLARYRSELGDDTFRRVMKATKGAEQMRSLYAKSIKIDETVSLLDSPIPHMETFNGKFLSSLQTYTCGVSYSYFTELSNYVAVVRRFRNANRNYRDETTLVPKCAEHSMIEAEARVRELWSGSGRVVYTEICDSRNESKAAGKWKTQGTYHTDFYISRGFSVQARKFPARKIDGMAPLHFSDIKEFDGYRTAKATGMRQHIKRGLDRSFTHSICSMWVAYNYGLNVYASSEKSYEHCVSLMKSRTVAAIDKKLRGES